MQVACINALCFLVTAAILSLSSRRSRVSCCTLSTPKQPMKCKFQ